MHNREFGALPRAVVGCCQRCLQQLHSVLNAPGRVERDVSPSGSYLNHEVNESRRNA